MLGSVIALIPLITTYFIENKFLDYWIMANIILILFLIFFTFRKNKNGITMKNLDNSTIIPYIEAEIKGAAQLIIINPNNNHLWLPNLLTKLLDYKTPSKIIGDAQSLLSIFKSGESNASIQYFLSSFSSNRCTIVLTQPNQKSIKIISIDAEQNSIFEIYDKNLVNEINSIFRTQNIYQNNIELNTYANPDRLLKIIDLEQKNYLDNYNHLKEGYIPFFGTNVLNTQSGWIEKKLFKELNTLDLTGNPALLLERHRYNKANREFIIQGGTIRRVFMIDRKKLQDESFLKPFIELIHQQKATGITLGLRYFDELSAHQKQDFIIYDNVCVLIEENQADSDYIFGKSTAYFTENQLKKYESIFWEVWRGDTMINCATDNLNELLQAQQSIA